jgi:prepilin-type N-terminal cleavage/methylation domain-containing protein
MHTNRAGYSLVETVIALAVGGILMSGAYRTLIVQEEGYSTTAAIVHDQDALRTALGVLEGELRETASIGGFAIGGTDILVAGTDSIRIRAPRRLGFVCQVIPSERAVLTWSEGELFEAGDGGLVFVDDDVTTYVDDHWESAQIAAVNSSSATCETSPTGEADQKVHLDDDILDGVVPGAPIRGVREVTYAIRPWRGGWGLARVDSEDQGHPIVSGLAAPGEGLAFRYFDATGAVTSDPTAVAAIEIQLTTAPYPSSPTQPRTLRTTVYLRNN